MTTLDKDSLRSVRATRYKAKIDSVAPASNRTSFEQREACFLGVSLENDNFAPAKLEGIVEWVSRRFKFCTVLIGDSIHRITLESTRSMPAAAASVEALRLGRAFISDQKHVFNVFQDRTDFAYLPCSEVQKWDAYADYHRRLRELFDSDDDFRASIEAFAHQYHGKRSSELSAAERARRLERSSDYFLEEFAIFACLRERGLSVMVYPGSFSTLTEIVNGEHAGAPDQLRDLTVVSLHLRGR